MSAGNHGCALLTFPQWQRAKPTCHWLLMSSSPPSRPLWTCLLLHSGRQVLAGWGQVLKCFCSFNESRCSHYAFTCTHARARTHTSRQKCVMAIQCQGSSRPALSSVICYHLKTGAVKYLVWSVFKHLEVPGFVPGSCIRLYEWSWWLLVDALWVLKPGCIIKNGAWPMCGCTRILCIGNHMYVFRF